MDREFTVFCIADLHGNLKAVKAVEDELGRADLVLVAGDLTSFGGERDAAAVLNGILACNERVLAVRGNCDFGPVDRALDKAGVNLESRCDCRHGLCVAGVGGGLRASGLTPFERPDAELATALGKAAGDQAPPGSGPGVAAGAERAPAAASCIPGDFILLTHEPPFGTAADVAHGGRHVGSAALRTFIEQRQPLLAVCGHIHESRATDSIGSTRVVNCGPFRDGFYAVAVLGGGPGHRSLLSVELKSI